MCEECSVPLSPASEARGAGLCAPCGAIRARAERSALLLGFGALLALILLFGIATQI